MPRVDDVLDDQHVATLNVGPKVHQDAHDAAGLSRAAAIARNGHKVDVMRHRNVAHQVGEEHHAALEHADQQEILILIVTRYLGAQRGDARL
jgi:hypothetical protein